MSLVLDEFYKQIPYAGVSASMGSNFDILMSKMPDMRKEYFEVFLPELKRKWTFYQLFN